MWFWLALAALLCWSGSDLFSKIGCVDPKDKNSHLKMVIMVGLVMGLHAAYEIFVGGVEFSLHVMWVYLPVSLLYISSMALGYLGLRFIELSISSPICNSSGALAALLYILVGERLVPMQYVGIVLVGVGVVCLAFVESHEDEELRAMRQAKSNHKYAKSFWALALPVLYCILDAAGTFADGLVMDKMAEEMAVKAVGANAAPALLEETVEAMSETAASMANVAYELTFLLAAVVCFIIAVVIRKDRLTVKAEGPKLIGACFETAGQFAYIFAIAANPAPAAAMISAYCAVSVLWSRIFLKEKLSWKHYLTIATAVVGIVILGAFDA